MVFIAKVSTRGRITIPAELRRELGWHGAMKVRFRDVGGTIFVTPCDAKNQIERKLKTQSLTPPATSPRDSQ